jgi:hypothetical protein
MLYAAGLYADWIQQLQDSQPNLIQLGVLSITCNYFLTSCLVVGMPGHRITMQCHSCKRFAVCSAHLLLP